MQITSEIEWPSPLIFPPSPQRDLSGWIRPIPLDHLINSIALAIICTFVFLIYKCTAKYFTLSSKPKPPSRERRAEQDVHFQGTQISSSPSKITREKDKAIEISTRNVLLLRYNQNCKETNNSQNQENLKTLLEMQFKMGESTTLYKAFSSLISCPEPKPPTWNPIESIKEALSTITEKQLSDLPIQSRPTESYLKDRFKELSEEQVTIQDLKILALYKADCQLFIFESKKELRIDNGKLLPVKENTFLKSHQSNPLNIHLYYNSQVNSSSSSLKWHTLTEKY
jgi:hypothetical protein